MTARGGDPQGRRGASILLEDDAPKPLAAPFALDLPEGEESDPSAAPPIEDAPDGQTALAVGGVLAARTSALGRFAVRVIVSFLTLVLSLAAWSLVGTLMALNPWLAWPALGLTGLAGLVLLVLAGQEVGAYLRQGRLDDLRAAVTGAADLASARVAVAGILRLYRGRPDLAWGRARLDEARAGAADAEALLALTEAELMAPLDRQALAEVEAAVRQVTTVTALVPLALADVVVALYANLRMIRRVSLIYGGRAGRLGGLRMLRRVAVAVTGAGALALGDDLLGSIAGGGVLGKLSRRFGEGVLNGALTARLGLAAIEELRPMPFAALPRPRVSAVVTSALAGLFGRGKGQGGDQA